MRTITVIAIVAAGGVAGPASPEPEPAPGSSSGPIDRSIYYEMRDARGPAKLEDVSTFHVAPPEPRVFAINDIISVIIDETTRTSMSQSLETERTMELNSQINEMVELLELLEARVIPGGTADLTLADVESESTFEGSGDAATSSTFRARLSVRVVDVKPNRTLVIEGRRRVEIDGEVKVIELTGSVREEDITERNTVLSSQIEGLALREVNEGEIGRASRKGLVARVLEALFAF